MTKEDRFRKTTAALAANFCELLNFVEQPVFIAHDIYPRWRFPNEGVAEAVLLKGARIISGLNSLICLLRGGYVQEIGVISRTIDEYSLDIMFLLEGFSKELTPAQQQFLDDFYQEEFDRPESPFESTQKRKTVRRQKVHAGASRALGDVVEPHHAQEIFRTLSQTFSGYTHAACPHVMEMYGGQPPRFHLDGMLNTPKIAVWLNHADHYFYRGIQAFMFISEAFGNSRVFENLQQLRTDFEEETGYVPKVSMADLGITS